MSTNHSLKPIRLFKAQKIFSSQPEGTSSLPKEVCQLCLGTVFSKCLHYSMKDYPKYLCKVTNTHFILCHMCRKHQIAQDWMRANHNLSKGIFNMNTMYNVIGADHVQVNSIRVNLSMQSQQRFGIAEIGSQLEKHVHHMK